MKRLDKPLEKDKDQVKEEPKIKVCMYTSGMCVCYSKIELNFIIHL